MSQIAVLVDSDSTVHRAVSDALAPLDFTCAAFAEPRRAARFLAENPAPALVIVDLGLRDGSAFCRELRCAPRLVHVPLVVTRGRRVGGAEEFAMRVGAAVLEKPFSPSALCDAVRQVHTRARAARRWWHRPRILIADDDPGILQTLASVARDEGWEPLCADDGMPALSLCGTGASWPALALLDVAMPGLDGVGVARRLRAAAPDVPIPIVLMSARDDVADSAERAGAIAHLKKPFALHEIVGLMERAVSASVGA